MSDTYDAINNSNASGARPLADQVLNEEKSRLRRRWLLWAAIALPIMALLASLWLRR